MAGHSKEVSSFAVRAAQSLSRTVNKASNLTFAIESKSVFSAQLLELAIQCYEKSKAIYSSETTTSLDAKNRLQSLNQSASVASNSKFLPCDPQKFNEQFRFAAGANFEQSNRHTPLMFNQAIKEHSSFASPLTVSKESDASIKADKNEAADSDAERNSTPKLK